MFVNNAALKRQIAREGKRWGLIPMVSIFGDVLVAEDIPCSIPIADGVTVTTRIRRDITSISSSYPWHCLLRNRKYKGERTAALRTEIVEAARQKAIRNSLDDIYHELSNDIRKADKGIIRLDYGLHTGRG